ncbi:esterase-like activity of phytase family protein [Holosporaceae bacterium 'Namur']|nr:esterase-like activity of phytase family protein [Holosporaceae bacterium 'Namur']
MSIPQILAEKISDTIAFDILIGMGTNFLNSLQYNTCGNITDFTWFIKGLCSNTTEPKEFLAKNTLTSHVPSAVLSYTGRYIAKEYLEKPLTGGIIFGAIKNIGTKSFLHTGSYYGFTYEYSAKYNKATEVTDRILSADTQVYTIEIPAGIISEMSRVFINDVNWNTISTAKENFLEQNYKKAGDLICEELYRMLPNFGTALIKGTIEGAASAFMVNLFSSTIIPVLYGVAATPWANLVAVPLTLALVITATRQIYESFSDLRQDETSIIHHIENIITTIGDKMAAPSEYNYIPSFQHIQEWIVEPAIYGPYKLLSQIWDRPFQALESAQQMASRFLPLVGKFLRLNKQDMKNETSFNFSSNDINEYHLYTHLGARALKEGVNIVKNNVLHGYAQKASSFSSEEKWFGEFSGATVDGDGKLVLISDRGAYVKAQPILEGEKITGFKDSVIGNFKDENGKFLPYNLRDIEEVTFYNGDCIVSHEGLNIENFSVYKGCDFENGDKKQSFTYPDNIKTLPKNEGIEAFGISKQGTALAISEYGRAKQDESTGIHEAYLWSVNKDYSALNNLKEFNYQSSPGYGVSGMTFLSNGGLLILERMFERNFAKTAEKYWIKLKYVSASKLSDVESGETVSGAELLEINPLSAEQDSARYSWADNFEAVTVLEGQIPDKTIVLMATDSNRAAFQKDFLLQVNIDNDVLNQDTF